YPQVVQGGEGPGVEVRHAQPLQAEPPDLTGGVPQHELVVDEVELDLQAAVSGRHERGGQATRGHVQRDLPPVVDHGLQRQAHLADDLGPHVHRVARVGPRGGCEVRPGRRRGTGTASHAPDRTGAGPPHQAFAQVAGDRGREAAGRPAGGRRPKLTTSRHGVPDGRHRRLRDGRARRAAVRTPGRRVPWRDDRSPRRPDCRWRWPVSRCRRRRWPAPTAAHRPVPAWWWRPPAKAPAYGSCSSPTRHWPRTRVGSPAWHPPAPGSPAPPAWTWPHRPASPTPGTWRAGRRRSSTGCGNRSAAPSTWSSPAATPSTVWRCGSTTRRHARWQGCRAWWRSTGTWSASWRPTPATG